MWKINEICSIMFIDSNHILKEVTIQRFANGVKIKWLVFIIGAHAITIITSGLTDVNLQP